MMTLGHLGRRSNFYSWSPDIDLLHPSPIPRAIIFERVFRRTWFPTIFLGVVLSFFFGSKASEFRFLIEQTHIGPLEIAFAFLLTWIPFTFFLLHASNYQKLISVRDRAQDEKLHMKLRYGATLALCLIGIIMFDSVRSNLSWTAIARHPILEILLLPATVASQACTFAIWGNWELAFACYVALIGGGIAFKKLSEGGLDWFYDSTARAGDEYAPKVNQPVPAGHPPPALSASELIARAGNVKVRQGRLYDWTPHSRFALTWLAAIYYMRGKVWRTLIVAISCIILLVWISGSNEVNSKRFADSIELLVIGVILALQIAFGNVVGMNRLVRKEILGPLPISPTSTVQGFLLIHATTGIVPVTATLTMAIFGYGFEQIACVFLVGLATSLVGATWSVLNEGFVCYAPDGTVGLLIGFRSILRLFVSLMPTIAFIFSASAAETPSILLALASATLSGLLAWWNYRSAIKQFAT